MWKWPAVSLDVYLGAIRSLWALEKSAPHTDQVFCLGEPTPMLQRSRHPKGFSGYLWVTDTSSHPTPSIPTPPANTTNQQTREQIFGIGIKLLSHSPTSRAKHFILETDFPSSVKICFLIFFFLFFSLSPKGKRRASMVGSVCGP